MTELKRNAKHKHRIDTSNPANGWTCDTCRKAHLVWSDEVRPFPESEIRKQLDETYGIFRPRSNILGVQDSFDQFENEFVESLKELWEGTRDE